MREKSLKIENKTAQDVSHTLRRQFSVKLPPD